MRPAAFDEAGDVSGVEALAEASHHPDVQAVGGDQHRLDVAALDQRRELVVEGAGREVGRPGQVREVQVRQQTHHLLGEADLAVEDGVGEEDAADPGSVDAPKLLLDEGKRFEVPRVVPADVRVRAVGALLVAGLALGLDPDHRLGKPRVGTHQGRGMVQGLGQEAGIPRALEVAAERSVLLRLGRDLEHRLLARAHDSDVEGESAQEFVGEQAVARTAGDQEWRVRAGGSPHPLDECFIVRDETVGRELDRVDVADGESDDVPVLGRPAQVLERIGRLHEVDEPGPVSGTIESGLHTSDADGEDRLIARHGRAGEVDQRDPCHGGGLLTGTSVDAIGRRRGRSACPGVPNPRAGRPRRSAGRAGPRDFARFPSPARGRGRVREISRRWARPWRRACPG